MIIVPTEKRFDWKHTPIVLIFIVFLNLFVFYIYQSADNQKTYGAIGGYASMELLPKEWPAYIDYLTLKEDRSLIKEAKILYVQEQYEQLIANIIMDNEFYQYMEKNAYQYFSTFELESWQIVRKSIHEQVNSVSYIRFGLIPAELEVHTLFTSQFLHGSTMHLMGNLFFLIVCGFAVEAALGHGVFLLFYLLTGIAGALLHTVFDLSSTIPTIGASGAISGVMAMYLGIFRLKKIEFFYWFFVFVGYFRAPALFILPLYIGKEIFSFYTDSDSNVAFMDHAGGFAMGAMLIAAALYFKPEIINDEYIEDDQEQDPLQEDLAKIYMSIENLEFETALRHCNNAIDIHEVNLQLVSLRYNLTKLSKSDEHSKNTLALLTLKTKNNFELRKLENVYLESTKDGFILDNAGTLRLALRFTNLADLSTAEKIFNSFSTRENPPEKMGILASKLSYAFGRESNKLKQQHYGKLSSNLMAADRP
jgi:membrane associated rhomboid family serine protease